MTPLGLTSAVMESWLTPTGLLSMRVRRLVVCSSFSCSCVAKERSGSLYGVYSAHRHQRSVLKPAFTQTVLPTWKLHVEVSQNLRHHEVATPIDLQRGRRVLRGPLEVDNIERRPLVSRPVHAPQPGVAPQHLHSSVQSGPE